MNQNIISIQVVFELWKNTTTIYSVAVLYKTIKGEVYIIIEPKNWFS